MIMSKWRSIMNLLRSTFPQILRIFAHVHVKKLINTQILIITLSLGGAIKTCHTSMSKISVWVIVQIRVGGQNYGLSNLNSKKIWIYKHLLTLKWGEVKKERIERVEQTHTLTSNLIREFFVLLPFLCESECNNNPVKLNSF